MATITAESMGFSIGSVVSRIGAVLSRHFLLFFALGIIAIIPQETMTYAMIPTAGANGMPVRPGLAHLSLFGGALLVGIIMSALLQVAIVYATVRYLSGQPAPFADAAMTAVRAFFPLLGLSILFVLGVGFGLLLLVVPGFILMAAWAVAVPVLVVEKPGVFGALGRSAALTKGHRWAIFGLLVVFSIAILILGFAIKPLLGLALISTGPLPDAYFLLDGAVHVIQIVVGATGFACIYFELRSEKEGIGPQQLAAVFD